MDAPPIEPPFLGPDDSGHDDPGTEDTGAPSGATSPRRLARRSDERLLGGVASGAAEFLGVDVVLVRLGFVVTAFFGGIGVLAYVLGWIVLPLTPPSASAATEPADRKQLLGYGLVALGLAAIGGRVGWTFRADGSFWALVLIGLGAAVLWLRTRDAAQEPPAPAADTPIGPRPPPAFAPTAELPTPTDPPKRTSAPASTAAPPRRRSYLGAVTWCGLLVLAGGAWLLDTSGAVEVDLGVVFALALAWVGLALVASAWFGRARGLIALGIPLVLVVGVLSLIDVPLDGGIGAASYQPRTVASMHRDYTLAIGNLSVDLRDVDFSGARRRVHAQLGIGQLNVTVPPDVRVVLDGHVRLGSVTAFNGVNHTCCPSDVHVLRRGRAGAGTVIVDADVGAGHLAVKLGEESLRATS